MENNKKNWKEIHEDFNDYYQQEWKSRGLTYQAAQEWIEVGFKTIDYYWVNQWKNFNFTPQETKPWLEIGLSKNSAGFVAYLRDKGHEPNLDLDSKLKEKTNAQDFLDYFYPLDQRKEITKLGISVKNLQGDLDLSDFVNLEELSCGNNKLTSLNLDKCSKLKIINCEDNRLTELKINHLSNLKELGCSNNQLTQLSLPSPNQIYYINCWDNNLQDLNFLSALSSEKLTKTLNIANNDFPEQDLSIFSRFVNSRY